VKQLDHIEQPRKKLNYHEKDYHSDDVPGGCDFGLAGNITVKGSDTLVILAQKWRKHT